MTVRASLLRVMLCLSLILNGSAYAATSVVMPPAHAVHSMAAHAKAGGIQIPCHAVHSAHAGEGASHHSAPGDGSPERSGHGTPDCCQTGACSCACVQQLQIALSAHVFQGAIVHLSMPAGIELPSHRAPVLALLLRPPIG